MEVEYLTLLLEGGLGKDHGDLLAAAQDFARTELGPWLLKLTQKLETETDAPFYPATACLLLGLVNAGGGVNDRKIKWPGLFTRCCHGAPNVLTVFNLTGLQSPLLDLLKNGFIKILEKPLWIPFRMG